MSLASLLSSLGLGQYTAPLTSLGYTEKDQLALPESELDSLLLSVSMLKGHAIKLKRALEQTRSRTEAPPIKRPRTEEPQSTPKKPTSLNTLTKDVERLMVRLADIEQTREDIGRARELILAVDLPRYRRALDQVEFIQKTIKAVDEAAEESSL